MNYKLIVLSVCNYAFAELPKTDIVNRLMAKWGYDYQPYIDPLWIGWPSKVRYFTSKVIELLDSDYTHVMFIDSADVVPLCGPDEIMDRWSKFDHPWVYGAEPFVWPPESFKPETYPTPMDATYRYLNGGMYIGELKHIAHYYKHWTRTPIVCEFSDQHWMAERYLWNHPDAIKLDVNAELFQNMCGSDWMVDIATGSLYNKATKNYPQLIHWNGGTDLATYPLALSLWEGML